MTDSTPSQDDRPRPRPEQAIDARRGASADKLASVSRVVKLLGRTGVPITVSAVHRLAGVSRSFTYENEEARALIVDGADPKPGQDRRTHRCVDRAAGGIVARAGP